MAQATGAAHCAAVTLTTAYSSLRFEVGHRSLAEFRVRWAVTGPRRAPPQAADGTLGTGLTNTSAGVGTAPSDRQRHFRVIACIALESPLRGGHVAARLARDDMEQSAQRSDLPRLQGVQLRLDCRAHRHLDTARDALGKKLDRAGFHRELRGRRPKGLPDCRRRRTVPAAW